MATYDKARKDSIIAGTILDDMTFQYRGKFDVTGLRQQCIDYDVEDNYQIYMARLRTNLLYKFLGILTIFTFIYCLILITSAKFVKEDLLFYVIFTLLAISTLLTNIWKFAQRPWITFLTTCLAVTFLVLMDVAVPILHAFDYDEIILPIYYSLIISSIYLFMPIPDFKRTLIISLIVSICYTNLFTFVTYRLLSDGSINLDIGKIITEVTYMIGLNLLGLYFRLNREIAIRRTFIYKKECVEENFLLLAAKSQERILLMTMIPPQIAEKMDEDIQTRLIHSSSYHRRRRASENFLHRKLFIQTHEDVTILYADIVNFTHLSTTLDVKTLVGTLHDLYVKFDDAALIYNVLRIQFLGDCYYCVANVATPNELHAKSCVKLGLQMIADIHRVSEKRKFTVNMRIGVHSGNVLSGVIGINKWQFDIYSRDVDIANQLEKTGEPNRVHISNRTLDLLDKHYKYERGTESARKDPFLRKHNISTYLIIPKDIDTLSIKSSKVSIVTTSTHDTVELKSVYSAASLQKMIEIEMMRESTTIPVDTVQIIVFIEDVQESNNVVSCSKDNEDDDLRQK